MNWILIRGLMREVGHWGDFPEKLATMSQGQVVCLDLPGVGTESERLFIPHVKQAMEDLRSRFNSKELDVGEDWGILGISLGGMIAMQWVHDYPADFKRIVIINSSARDFAPWKRLTPSSMKTVFELFFEEDLVRREKKIIDMTVNLRKNDLKLIDSWVKIAQRSKFSRLVAVNQLAAAAQFSLPSKIKIPMLVLASRADRMVNYKCSEQIAKKYNATIKIHPTAGHDIAVDDASWVIEQIVDWKSNH